ncbi:MAG: type III pantothenate kinase [Bacteroidota bacterium]|nr:type III pantothenate kinase [Bacteroidota bacterium]
MNLIIDIGNTNTKVILFEKEEIIRNDRYDFFDEKDLQYYFVKYHIKAAIVSSVGIDESKLIKTLEKNCSTIKFDHNTLLPVKNRYRTPETLGKDRIAAAVGAEHEFKGSNILIIDAGTCVTYDIVSDKGEYLGGAIAPGKNMRFKAMHAFTERLPLILQSDTSPVIGDDTKNSIIAGVNNGIICEVDGMITFYKELFENLIVIVTGGDMNYFDNKLKSNIFARSNVVALGLNKILRYHFEENN